MNPIPLPSPEPARPLGRVHRPVALAAAILAGALPLAAQPETPEGPGVQIQVEGDDLIFSIEERGGLPLVDFIKIAETLTGKTFTYSETDIQNNPDSTITFIGTKRLRREHFFAFFQTMLYIKGFATLIRGEDDTEVIEIVAIAGPKRADLTTSAVYVPPEEIPEFANQTGVPILTSVPLEYTNAQVAQNQLRPFLGASAGAAPTLQLGAVSQSLLLQGFGPQVYAAYQLLQLVDVPPEVPEHEVRVVKLEHAAAEELEPILQEILESRQRAQRQAEQQQAGVSGAPLQTGRQEGIKIVPHGTLNALLLAGVHEEVIEAQELIARLDIPIELTDGDTHVYTLRNVLAEDLHRTVQQFLQQDLQAERQQLQQQGGQGGGGPRQPRQTVVVPHRESNALLISASATKFKQLVNMLDKLDRRQPQVLIEAAVVELSTTDLERLGVELAGLDIAQDEFTRPFGFTSFGITSLEDTDGDGLPDIRLPDFANLQGVTGGIISSDDFAIPLVVNALASDDRANILSLPSVVVNNNENALVRSVEARPTQQITQGTATTQAGAGREQEAGIELNISPSISSNNYLRLNIGLTVSRFITPFDPGSVTAGVRTERQITTAVTMPSGHTMVLGGVIEDTESDTSSGIPFLKDIPLLGVLFRSTSNSLTKTNLYFFLTPHILDEEDFSDLAETSFRKKLEAAEYIGHRRIQIVDRQWRARPETLEDPGATIEDIEARGGFDIPLYQRPQRTVEPLEAPGPLLPEEAPGEPGETRRSEEPAATERQAPTEDDPETPR